MDSRIFQTIIIGTGIAGSSLAYRLEKEKQDYLIITDKNDPLKNTSSLSYGHCRIANTQEELKEIIRIYENELGDNKDKIQMIYQNSNKVRELFEELDISYTDKSFGIIPLTKERGGLALLRLLQKNIKNIRLETSLLGFQKQRGVYKLNLHSDEEYEVECENLVLAVGGYNQYFNNQYNAKLIHKSVKKNGGNLINEEVVFRHPFGYNEGEVLNGASVSNCNLIDEVGAKYFSDDLENLIRADSYHEKFPELLNYIDSMRKKGKKLYYQNGASKFELNPKTYYTSGGIETDEYARVNGCENLFAIGECQADGSQNGGRLPGHPFTAAIVYSYLLPNILRNYKNNRS